MKEGTFVIHVVGKNTGLVNELSKMALTKMVGNQKIEVKNTNTLDPNDAPNILFLLQESSPLLQDACNKCKGKGTLIVTERPGLARSGAAINFVIADNKQKFEYNKSNAVKAGLKTSEEFKDLAITVTSK